MAFDQDSIKQAWIDSVLVYDASTKPIGGLLDKRFHYVPACKTNVAATIARVKAEIASGERKL